MKLTSLSTSPHPETGYWLLHEGARALAQVERNGIRIDRDRLQRSKKECGQRIREIESQIHNDPIAKEWRKRFGDKTNYSAPAQLGHMLFDCLGCKGGVKTKTGKWSTKDEDLQKIDHPFVRMCSDAARLRKVRDTFLIGIERELCGEFLHPSFSLNIARTYRSSSSDPNFQNFPIRSEDSARIIRECFIPREERDRRGAVKRWMLIESDYGGIEVCVAACYHKDPTMISYIEDKSKDMHRDMAAQIYKLEPSSVGKMPRYCAKNMFVFPQFYGDWYQSCAQSMWEAIDKFKLESADGTPLKQHLKQNGIKALGACNPKEQPRKGTFEYHMKEVEDNFWNVRFPVYTDWKKRWYAKYQRKGYFDTLTGFRVSNYHNRKDVINYPVQGSAFHCLLWAMIKIQKELRRRKMRALIVGQIHDSIVADVPEEEVPEYLEIVKQIKLEALRETWPWIIVPLTVEIEGSTENWFKKRKIEV